MLELTDMQVIRMLAKKHRFSFEKGLGQNFLIDPGLLAQLVLITNTMLIKI